MHTMRRKKQVTHQIKAHRKKYFADILISVAIILNNDQDIIAQSLQDVYEVLRNENKYFEIIVIDNGSVDHSKAVVSQIQKRLPNIRLLTLSNQYEDGTAV